MMTWFQEGIGREFYKSPRLSLNGGYRFGSSGRSKSSEEGLIQTAAEWGQRLEDELEKF